MDHFFYSSSSSSIRVSILIIPHHNVTSHKKLIPIKPLSKPTKFLLNSSRNPSSIGLSHSGNCCRQVPSRHAGRFSIRASTQIGASESDPAFKNVLEFKDVFWRFLRPHTIRGTTLGSDSLVARALIENSNLIKWSLLFKAICSLLALICGNGYIVGINQIYDIGIDKVNKPYVPIVAGHLSVQSAWALVLLLAAAGLLIVSFNFGRFITSLTVLGFFLVPYIMFLHLG